MDASSVKGSLRAAWEMIQAGQGSTAEALCARLLEADPDLWEAEFALGVAHFRQGDNEGALAHLERYLAKEPNAVSAFGLTAQLLLESGRSEEALELGRRAHEIRPDEGPVLLLHLSGRNFLARGQPLSALKAFQELIRLTPKQPPGYLGAAEAYHALGSSFDEAEMYGIASRLAPTRSTLLTLGMLELKLGRPSRSLAAAKAVLSKSPTDPQANILAGQSLIELDRVDEAAPFWEAAGSAGDPSADLKRGASLSMMGRFEEGEVYLRRSIDAEPRQGNAYQLIFANRKATEGDAELVVQMGAISRDDGVAPTDRAALAFALGKAWDDLGDPGRGFAFYDEAHEIQRSLLETPFRPETAHEQFRAQRLLFTAGKGPRVDRGPQPIFVVGMLRSGTTLMEQILCAHSQVTGAGEVDFWTASEPLMIDRGEPLFLEEAGAERRSAYRRILDSFGEGRLRVVDKFPGNLNLVGLLHHLFPDAHFLSMRRNPIDVAVSIWGIHSNPFSPFTTTRESIVFAIRHAIEQADHWAKMLPSGRFLNVRYEELVSNPEIEVRKVLDFCGLPWEDACLNARARVKKVRTPSLWQVRQPVNTSSIDRWKRYEPWLGEFKNLEERAPE